MEGHKVSNLRLPGPQSGVQGKVEDSGPYYTNLQAFCGFFGVCFFLLSST